MRMSAIMLGPVLIGGVGWAVISFAAARLALGLLIARIAVGLIRKRSIRESGAKVSTLTPQVLPQL